MKNKIRQWLLLFLERTCTFVLYAFFCVPDRKIGCHEINLSRPEHIQNSVKGLRWSILQTQLTGFNGKLFSKNASSQMFDRVLNTPLRSIQQSKMASYHFLCSPLINFQYHQFEFPLIERHFLNEKQKFTIRSSHGASLFFT